MSNARHGSRSLPGHRLQRPRRRKNMREASVSPRPSSVQHGAGHQAVEHSKRWQRSFNYNELSGKSCPFPRPCGPTEIGHSKGSTSDIRVHAIPISNVLHLGFPNTETANELRWIFPVLSNIVRKVNSRLETCSKDATRTFERQSLCPADHHRTYEIYQQGLPDEVEIPLH